MAPLLLSRVFSVNKQCWTRHCINVFSTRSQPASTVFRTGYVPKPKVQSPENYTGYHEVSTDNWKFVERLIPPVFVPPHPQKETYPSGWTPPPADKIPDLPYFVERTKNGMVPVYLNFEAVRGQRKITMVKHIEGDIWALKEELCNHLNELKEKAEGKPLLRPVICQVHEVGMYIKFKGDHVLAVRDWLLKKGF